MLWPSVELTQFWLYPLRQSVYTAYGMSDQKSVLPFYRLDAHAALTHLDSKREGLTNAQAAILLEKHGPNLLLQLHKESLLIKYLRQFKDLMILLLLASSAVAFYLGDNRTGPALVALVLFNTLIGFGQEFKAERIMESLQQLVVSKSKVVRSGKLEEVSSSELVPGDVIYIEEGDSVPADVRLLEESELASNDFALTGESNPSRKFTHAISANVELGSRHNLLFMGTTIATGHGYGVVIATGMQTELGRIASLSQDTKSEASPLQKEINHTASLVTKGTVAIGLIILLIAIKADLNFKDSLLFAVGVASSLIPQGLPAEINTALAQAANKLARARALVKKLSAVETLGATNIICTDKTGTLTKNEMTVEQLLIGKTTYQVSGTGYEANGQILHGDKPVSKSILKDMSLFFTTGALASNARVNQPDSEHLSWHVIGDPTEGALITLAKKAGLDPLSLDAKYPELKEFAFDSARKRMSSVRAFGDGKKLYVFVKGAPESVLEHCEDIWDHNHVRSLSQKDQKYILDYNTSQAALAMRNLGYAYKVLPTKTDHNKLVMEDAESGLTWLGMVSMVDPLHEEVPSAMRAAHAAHIKVSIITGDYAITAKAIAAKAGLAKSAEDIVVISGEELRHLEDSRVLELVRKGGVIFSRVSPEDKLRIVGLVKDSGLVVAVTGDGINDAPALKRADIGVAMGRTGTDVAKQSASIVLLDDSFGTLVGAIKQGRIIFQNIKKGALSCFTTNAAELVVNLTSLAAFSIFSVPLALTVMEILAIDLIAELFPIAALGWDKAEGELMREKPRNLHDHILNKQSIVDLLWCGIIIGGLAYVNYLLLIDRAGVDPGRLIGGSSVHMKATAITYLTIVLCQLINILQRRSPNGLFTRYQFHNKQLWLAYTLSISCVLIIIYNPIIAPYFGAGPLGAIDWIFALSAAAIFLAIREFQRYSNKHHSREAVISLHRQLHGSKIN